MTRGVLHGLALGLVLFNIFVVDMDSEISHSLSSHASNIKMCGVIVALERRDGIQRDPDRQERWAFVNLMKFNKAKCKVLPLDWGNLKHKYRAGQGIKAGLWIKSNPVEKDLGQLIDQKVNMTQQRALAAQRANCILGCIESSMPNRTRMFSLSALRRPHCNAVSSSGASSKLDGVTEPSHWAWNF
ncbi:hypothetical protein TURU_056826 [Turdus rufiventris]|nr:hypothetical protein TURU_056826 [Turdus rufiventris]